VDHAEAGRLRAVEVHRLPMIRSLSLRNFKAHRSTDIELGRLTVLVGPNGAGKTSVLEALQIMSQLVTVSPRELLQGELEPETLLYRGSAQPIELQTRGDPGFSTWSTAMRLILGEPGADGKRPWEAELECRTPKLERRDITGAFSFSRLGDEPLWRELASATLFSFNPRKIAAPGYSDNAMPIVEADGENTAAALAALKLSDDEHFDAVVSGLRRIVPPLKRIRIRPARVMRTVPVSGNPRALGDFQARNIEVSGHRIAFDFSSAHDLPASSVSEGTLVTLALLTALHAPTRPKLLLIDDIEQSLHPLAQIELMRQISELLEQFPDLQIVATTHSPYVLDGVDPSQVLVFFPRESGDIAVKRLSAHPDAERSKGTLSAGQIWSLDPEEWVAKEKTAS
jgi:predicted ATPase